MTKRRQGDGGLEDRKMRYGMLIRMYNSGNESTIARLASKSAGMDDTFRESMLGAAIRNLARRGAAPSDRLMRTLEALMPGRTAMARRRI